MPEPKTKQRTSKPVARAESEPNLKLGVENGGSNGKGDIDGPADETSLVENLIREAARHAGEMAYEPCADLDEANARISKASANIRDEWIRIGLVVNDVAARELFRPHFEELNAWMDSPQCVVNHTQAHQYRRALRLHTKLLDAGKEPLPGVTYYKLAMQSAPEGEWVTRADAIRHMSTREADTHLKAQKQQGEEELALAALVRAVKRCEEVEPKKALAGLAASEDRALIVARLERVAKVLNQLLVLAEERPVEAGVRVQMPWIRYCLTPVDRSGRPLADDAPVEVLALDDHVSFCGHLDAADMYATEDLCWEMERAWTCRACGGTEFDFTEWPPSAEVGHGQE